MREAKIIIEKNAEGALVATFWEPEELQPDTYSWIATLDSTPGESRIQFEKRCYGEFMDLAPCHRLHQFQILHAVGQFASTQF